MKKQWMYPVWMSSFQCIFWHFQDTQIQCFPQTLCSSKCFMLIILCKNSCIMLNIRSMFGIAGVLVDVLNKEFKLIWCSILNFEQAKMKCVVGEKAVVQAQNLVEQHVKKEAKFRLHSSYSA